MMSFSSLSKRPSIFRSFTGRTIDEFNALCETVEKNYGKFNKKRLSKRKRENEIGQGRKFKLELINRLLMLLVYYRLYTTYTLTGYLFNLDQSNVCRDIKMLELLVKKCVPLPEKIHRKTQRIKDLEELGKYYPELKAFIDATEQEIPRPKNKRRRKSYYSGKKKRHTVKTQILVNKKGLIIHKTGHDKGRKHDYDIFKKKRPKIPKDVKLGGDSGYQGIKDDFPEIKSIIPRKKQKGKERTKEDKKFNKKFSKERVIVENTIGKMKKFGIFGGEFRNRLDRYDTMTSIVSGLVNFRTMTNMGYDVNKFI